MYERYNSPMRTFLESHFPSLGCEADDLIQETMAALARQLPNWRYSPDEKGRFHCYLTGILKHKALAALKRRARDSRIKRDYGKTPKAASGDGREDAEWMESAMEIAIREVLSDKTVNAIHRNVFRRVALQNEPPAAVAEDTGISRANVDTIKSRMIARAAAIAERLCKSYQNLPLSSMGIFRGCLDKSGKTARRSVAVP